MSSRPRSQKQFSQNTYGLGEKKKTHDQSVVLCEMLKGERQLAGLKAKDEEGTQELKSLKDQTKELQDDINKIQERFHEAFVEDEDADDALEEAKADSKEFIQKEAELERLKKEYAELMERREELQHQVQRHSMYKHFMERVLKITKFGDTEALADYTESLLHFQDQFYQKEMKLQDEVDQQKKALLTLQDQHNLVVMQKNSLLSQLQTELEKTQAEALTWEQKWNHIQETAAKKTLQLGKIKMAILNLYEMTAGAIGEKEGVDMNDTETQLNKLQVFSEDENDIVKQYEARLHAASDGKKPNKDKGNTKPRKK
ncbi:coiled-coil domain-containing protein 42 homolog [Astatotilapia calliptera]|uniref:coiled-coil domain-containing protein 42 homolog n=1 Tax=Astatotilapia calliptera TaxID=8154 RepID=UPI000E3F9E87|nr:coiled-coil domain-containing protein 42 homolog [Astatotilapia calliptera]